MIKVNLKKTKVSGTQNTKTNVGAVETFTGTVKDVQQIMDKFGLDSSLVVKLVFKLLLIACFPLGLKVYEKQNIGKLEIEKTQQEELLNQANQKLSAIQTKLDSYGYLQDKANEFHKKKEHLKKLAEKRLIIVRTIDALQDRTPKTVWLEKLTMRVERGEKKIEISGKSFNEANINAFAGNLKEVLDQNSIVINTRDIKEGGSVVKVEFSLKGVVI